MAMSAVRWATLAEIERGDVSLTVLSQPSWLFQHAVAVHTLLKDDELDLEPWANL